MSENETQPKPGQTWCRDCLAPITAQAVSCPQCLGTRLLAHREINTLSIAHIDCDAFFASVEKRDHPELESVPLLIGHGGKRGVVATACYLARAYGVRSAMPMYQARRLCPSATIMRPDIAKYSAISRQMRTMMRALTPLVEPLSIDEAFLDLGGTERLHGAPPVHALMTLQNQIEKQIGISVSVGLSFNKFLAKTASALNKPKGFSLIGKHEAVGFLRDKPVDFVYGVGPAFARRLNIDGLQTLGQIQDIGAQTMQARYGLQGGQLAHLAHGHDTRPVNPHSERKSISSETTFEHDIGERHLLEHYLWQQCERTAQSAKKHRLQGKVAVLKLKTSGHRSLTRQITLNEPTQLADTLFTALREKLRTQAQGHRFRLIGAGLTQLSPAMKSDDDRQTDLLDDTALRRAKAERAMDKAREKYGPKAVQKGRALKK